MTLPSAFSATPALTRPGAAAPVAAGPTPGASAVTGFGRVWADVTASPSRVEVQSGDTLIGLVKAHYRQQGLPISESQAFRLAHQVAADNGIPNPDRILPGQQVDFARLQLPALARAPSVSGQNFTSSEDALASRYWRTPSAVPATLTADGGIAGEHPVLEQTLARAVDKGFIASGELTAVRSRVLALAERFRFSPDDFARLTLMESGGMNPKASNGRCHGVIQFCDGPGRGAASVGYRDNPRAILGVPLLQQLDLVERYFNQVGLQPDKGQEKLGLDELYLSVLMPAARSEKGRDAPLDIPGTQARLLHVGQNRQRPITRDSLVNGLHAYTQAVLAGTPASQASARFAKSEEPSPPTR